MSIPSFSAFPEIPQRSTPEADFDAKMYALFQHFATTHRQELLAFIQFLENNVTAIEGAINGVTIGLTHPAAAKFTSLAADSISGAAVQASPDDATAGRLMKVGAFGLGTEFLSHQPHRLADIDNLNTPTGFYGVGSETTGDKPNSFGVVQVVPWYTTGTGISQITQIFWPTFPAPRMYIRNYRDGSGWSPWREVYSQERVVGTVSHSGGTPTGAVIERGSNANGEYVRFADGTQICTRSVSLGSRSSTSESRGLYRSDTYPFGLPAVFAPSTTVGASLSGDLFPNGILHAISANTSQWSVRMGAPSSFASLNCGDVVLTAVGRWF
ncbi:pyocin knob domain-containing protein [Tritonibacter mobilis]|uniref:pyocin knob domain-containing protein n=1 Tax=Tritonibacter mobilis TaxID=379347 RepID=UPI0008068A31|nr:pyocin knob domain-containing protein [Tritonibacter mobilis]